MYAKGRKEGTVRFAITLDGAPRSVCVAGDFNHWTPVAMRRQRDGTYVKVVPVRPGTHEYKYIVNGEWTVDPDHGVWAMNCYGTMNSVMDCE